jgi:hypothetical protein
MIEYLPHLGGVPMTLTKAIVDSLVTLSRLEVPPQEEGEERRRTRRLSRRHA